MRGCVKRSANQQASKRLSFRHGDSTDDWNGATGTTKQAMMAAVALDSGNEWDEYMEAADAAVFIAAYTRLVEMVVHVDMDVIIRKSDGTIRTTLATDVADSSNITSKEWQTFSGTYTFPGYTVVSGTDYLEIDLFADATLNSSQENVSVDFRIDDPGLPISSQTLLPFSSRTCMPRGAPPFTPISASSRPLNTRS